MKFIPSHHITSPMGHAYLIKFIEDLFLRHRSMKMDLTEFNKCMKQENKTYKILENCGREKGNVPRGVGEEALEMSLETKIELH